MTLTPLNAIRERAEKATKEQLIEALMLAVVQRNGYRERWDYGGKTTAQDDAALAAILEPKSTPPRTNDATIGRATRSGDA